MFTVQGVLHGWLYGSREPEHRKFSPSSSTFHQNLKHHDTSSSPNLVSSLAIRLVVSLSPRTSPHSVSLVVLLSGQLRSLSSRLRNKLSSPQYTLTLFWLNSLGLDRSLSQYHACSLLLPSLRCRSCLCHVIDP